MNALDRFREWFDRTGDRAIPNRPRPTDSALVIGLGRFGSALAVRLMELGVDVMAIDTDPDLVNGYADRLTHVRLADGTQTTTLAQLGASDFGVAVVAIGTGIEASVLTTAALRDVGAKTIWAKAITTEHGKILTDVGAHHVVYPERQMGEKVAHIVAGHVVDYFDLDEGFVLAELLTPQFLEHVRLGDSELRQKHSVTVVCHKPAKGLFTHSTADTILEHDDTILVAGPRAAVERFTERAAS